MSSKKRRAKNNFIFHGKLSIMVSGHGRQETNEGIVGGGFLFTP